MTQLTQLTKISSRLTLASAVLLVGCGRAEWSTAASSSPMNEGVVSQDASAPVVGSLKVVADGPTNATLTWAAASDETTASTRLVYKVVRATSESSIDSIAKAGTVPTSQVLVNWTPNLGGYRAVGLAPNSNVAFAVLVRDESGNVSLYSPRSVGTSSAYRIFVSTAAVAGGSLGSIAAADLRCMQDPARPTGAVYKAMIADGSTRRACVTPGCTNGGAAESVDWVLAPSTRYIRPDGSEIASSNSSGLLQFSLTNAIGTGFMTWTGLNTDWTTADFTCNAWSSLSGAGIEGRSATRMDGALRASINACTVSNRLYCVEQP